jgi:hypothetical protein
MNTDNFINLLLQPEVRTKAIDDALRDLGSLKYQDEDDRIVISTRINDIFSSIIEHSPHSFEYACSRLSSIQNRLYKLMLEWLSRLMEQQEDCHLTTDAIVAAQIFFGIYDDATWQEIGALLISMLDSSDLNLRACAAAQIGKFSSPLFCSWDTNYDYAAAVARYPDGRGETWYWQFEPGVYEEYEQKFQGVPPLVEMMSLFQTKEIERPGVAGAWLFASGIMATTLDVEEWILDVLERSPEPEPYIPYFLCNLKFLAHEIFCSNADVIRRLIDMGRMDIACAASQGDDKKIDRMEPLLIEIGYSEDPLVIQRTSWHLAYYYHYLHPQGAAAGYVELIDDLPEIDLFLLFSRQEERESPYAVVIYPKGIETLSREIAQKWVERIFPESVSVDCTYDEYFLEVMTNMCYPSGFVDYQFAERITEIEDSDEIDRVTISYRSSTYWNPRQFLEIS